MNPFASLLVTEHLKDLLREAEDERRARLVRGSTPSTLRSALAWALDRVPTARPVRVRPAVDPMHPVVGRTAGA